MSSARNHVMYKVKEFVWRQKEYNFVRTRFWNVLGDKWKL
jgi:hypothetical protein